MSHDRHVHSPDTGWEELPATQWWGTLEALHRWTQVVGKIRMSNSPWVNHSWSVPLYLSARGLTTSLIPHGDGAVSLSFDLLDDTLIVEATTGRRRDVPLRPGSIAGFYAAVRGAMAEVGKPVEIDPTPSEIAGGVAFDRDTAHRPYDHDHAVAFWRALVRSSHVLGEHRARFTGKASPVHFFWGGFDLATSRFSGRQAPRHPGGMTNLPDDIVRDAYSHELTSVGFWPGTRTAPEPVYYAYAYPVPDGYASWPIEPAAARWAEELGEFVLPYAAVAACDDPAGVLLGFFESAHRAAAELGRWDRALECEPPMGPDWWRTRPHDHERTAAAPQGRTKPVSHRQSAADVSGEPANSRAIWRTIDSDGPARRAAAPPRRSIRDARSRSGSRYPDPTISTIDDPRSSQQ